MNFDSFNEQKRIEAYVRKHMEYLLAEGIVLIERYSDAGEPVYRLKTDEEVQAELDEILNS